eukprot:342169-Pleurochrysis_carterae.AAC.1
MVRYLKFRFQTHHGTEHYWSLSLLRVYGQNQLDKFTTENAHRASLLERAKQAEAVPSAADTLPNAAL